MTQSSSPNMSIAITCQDFSDSVEPVDEELPVPRGELYKCGVLVWMVGTLW